MVIDTSALVAILFGEPDRNQFIAALEKPGPKLLSSVNALEAAIVVEGRKLLRLLCARTIADIRLTAFIQRWRLRSRSSRRCSPVMTTTSGATLP
jgi:uncharacterized protein with PIN domain